jgi:hypothetical protein
MVALSTQTHRLMQTWLYLAMRKVRKRRRPAVAVVKVAVGFIRGGAVMSMLSETVLFVHECI